MGSYVPSSEMPHLGDFRKTQIALQNVVAVRFENGVVRTFLTDKVQAPAGNDLSLTYHSGNWTELPCEVKHGGMVWTTLDTNPSMSVDEWTAGAFDCIADAIDTEEMEVFHYHKAVINTNYKLWHDTNSEFYHDFMHYFNRVSGFNDEYFARKISLLIMVMLMSAALLLTMKSMTDLRIGGSYLFPICRPTSGTWLTYSPAITLTYVAVPTVVTA